jgi:hypothetical protein
MQSNKLAGAKSGASAQRFLDISEIREGAVILRDGTMRSVILTSSINFALKSEDEQQALISAYVSFLNTIDYPLQIVVQSRKLNIESYIERLKEEEKTQQNDLLKLQMVDYRNFIGELVEMGEIMSKRFFVVVPWYPWGGKTKSFFAKLGDIFKPLAGLKVKEEEFKKQRAALMQRTELVIGGLQSMGLTCVPLDTQGLIELFYECYNPELRETEKVAEVGEINIEK